MESINILTEWLTQRMDPGMMFQLIIGFQVAEFIVEQVINYRQRQIYKNTIEMPSELLKITTKETFEKSRVYALDKSCFGLFSDFFNMILMMGLLAYDGIALMWSISGDLLVKSGLSPDGSEIYQGAIFIFLFNTFSLIFKIPFSIYYTFWLEEKHGFNKQTAGFFIKDTIKQFVLMQVLMVFLGSAITYIVMVGGDYFFITLWVFFVVVTMFFMTIYPSVIAPLFDKYTPLPDGALRTQIEEMAASINFPLKKLYVVEGSKRSSHSNAYFYGFYKNKRIVLFDTLLKSAEGDKGCSDDEILAVLGHELGHWKLNHVLKNIIVMQVNMLLIFVVFAVLFKCKPLYQALGFTTTPILIGLMVLTQYVMAPYFFFFNWIMAQTSRQYEFQADRFAKDMGRQSALAAALVKLNSDNLGFPIYDSWYSALHNSHPPLLERLRALEESKDLKKQQ